MSGFNAWYYRQLAIWSSFLKRDEMALEYWERVRTLRVAQVDPQWPLLSGDDAG